MEHPTFQIPVYNTPTSAPVLSIIYDEDGSFKNIIKNRYASLEQEKIELKKKLTETEHWLEQSRNRVKVLQRTVKGLEDKIEELEHDKNEAEEQEEKPKRRGRPKKELKQIDIKVNFDRENNI
jgi:chromosome segregation ATPase